MYNKFIAKFASLAKVCLSSKPLYEKIYCMAAIFIRQIILICTNSSTVIKIKITLHTNMSAFRKYAHINSSLLFLT